MDFKSKSKFKYCHPNTTCINSTKKIFTNTKYIDLDKYTANTKYIFGMLLVLLWAMAIGSESIHTTWFKRCCSGTSMTQVVALYLSRCSSDDTWSSFINEKFSQFAKVSIFFVGKIPSVHIFWHCFKFGP